MPQNAPPPPPPGKVIEPKDDNILVPETFKFPVAPNVLVDWRLDESAGFSKIYLDVEAIRQTWISLNLDPDTTMPRTIVDGLNTIHNARGKEAINSSLPSEEVLQMCKKATTGGTIMHAKKKNGTQYSGIQLEQERMVGKAGSKNSSHPAQRRRMHDLEVEGFAEREDFGSWQTLLLRFWRI